MNWRVKGLVQQLLSKTPGGLHVNNLLQWHLGGLKQFEANVDSKVRDDWFVIVNHMQELSYPIASRVFLEIGTGWFPTLPVCFYLAGASNCLTYDLNRYVHFGRTRRMFVRLESHLEDIAAKLGESYAVIHKRWEELLDANDCDEFLKRAHIEYQAPANASMTGLPASSVDVVFSNSVLEHVDRAALLPIMRESRRVLKPGGIAIHSVDCGDHYSYFDRAISPINFLQFEENEWKLWNNDFQYQNRLRPQDFLDCAESAGLEIVLNHQRPRPELLEDFDRFPFAAEFRHYAPEQLCTTSLDFVAIAADNYQSRQR